ncbi:MAG: Bifunctional protein HldE [Syntrophorhabdaceae bacterium PtaU1.Bin034]|nr:MAG: Bifunctional protein HldE [Syntrophorhabdaceae bacterium PtaU1.Bin034]
MNNLLALGAHVFPIGCIGRDEAGDRLVAHFSLQKNANLEGIIRHDGRTVTKTRILAGDTHTSKQQVIRIDREIEGPYPDDVRAQLKQKLIEIAPHVDAIVLSDYEYGLIDRDMMAFAIDVAREKIVVGDSRYNLKNFRGITLITPNESEAYALSGIDEGQDVEEVGRQIIASMEVQGLLITRGNKGMSLFLRDGAIYHIPISGSDEIADVTGAGDTVAAAVTLALASGADLYTACRIANCAAGVVVMKRGTAVVTVDELRKVIEENGSLDS